MRYDPGSHGGYIETKDQTFFTGLTINSDMPLFANTGSAGTSQSPDFFDTATSNYVNVGKPKGEMGWIFLGWAWVDGDGLGWQDYSDAPITIDGLVYNRAEKPTKVTFRTTFVAQWTPTETIVRFQPNKGSIAPGHETEMANKTLYVGDTVVLPRPTRSSAMATSSRAGPWRRTATPPCSPVTRSPSSAAPVA